MDFVYILNWCMYFLLSGADLWSVAPFNTAAPEMQVPRDVSISGYREPTSSTQLLPVRESVSEQLEKYGLKDVAFNLFTNARLFHKPSVKIALDALWIIGGRVWAKLDAETQSWFEQVDGTKLSSDKVTQNIT